MIKKTFQVKKQFSTPLRRSIAGQTGKRGEGLARKFLEQKGYTFIQSNYHIRGGEIDLIMAKNRVLIFVEVKTRLNTRFGLPEESVTYNKRQKLLRSIRNYLQVNPLHLTGCAKWQLDVIAILLQPLSKSATVKHFENILVV